MTDVRLFTLEDAERTLPLVRRVVQDLQAEYPAWREAVGRFEVVSTGLRPEHGETPELQEAQASVAAHAARISEYLQELEAIGCVLKGFEAGQVDFYSLRDDRLVFLCWTAGEERITHWHELDAGFAGRQPIDDSILTETSP